MQDTLQSKGRFKEIEQWRTAYLRGPPSYNRFWTKKVFQSKKFHNKNRYFTITTPLSGTKHARLNMAMRHGMLVTPLTQVKMALNRSGCPEPNSKGCGTSQSVYKAWVAKLAGHSHFELEPKRFWLQLRENVTAVRRRQAWTILEKGKSDTLITR